MFFFLAVIVLASLQVLTTTPCGSALPGCAKIYLECIQNHPLHQPHLIYEMTILPSAMLKRNNIFHNAFNLKDKIAIESKKCIFFLIFANRYEKIQKIEK